MGPSVGASLPTVEGLGAAEPGAAAVELLLLLEEAEELPLEAVLPPLEAAGALDALPLEAAGVSVEEPPQAHRPMARTSTRARARIFFIWNPPFQFSARLLSYGSRSDCFTVS